MALQIRAWNQTAADRVQQGSKAMCCTACFHLISSSHLILGQARLCQFSFPYDCPLTSHLQLNQAWLHQEAHGVLSSDVKFCPDLAHGLVETLPLPIMNSYSILHDTSSCWAPVV